MYSHRGKVATLQSKGGRPLWWSRTRWHVDSEPRFQSHEKTVLYYFVTSQHTDIRARFFFFKPTLQNSHFIWIYCTAVGYISISDVSQSDKPRGMFAFSFRGEWYLESDLIVWAIVFFKKCVLLLAPSALHTYNSQGLCSSGWGEL